MIAFEHMTEQLCNIGQSEHLNFCIICLGVKMADRSSEQYDPRVVQDPVVGREVFPLGSRPPGLMDPSQPGRQAHLGGVESPPVRHLGVEALLRASQANVARPSWESEESVSLASDYYGSMFSLYGGRTFTIHP